jgi:hypothetical protein
MGVDHGYAGNGCLVALHVAAASADSGLLVLLRIGYDWR